uniref:Matrin-type domain-containing protein n=1 Tax=Pseudonaja textilis TaxID=8673 RepID=A0A670ZTJ3_PSETE
MLRGKENEKGGVEDAGDFLSSQIPEDPSVLVTVDEIHEDSDEQPLMTLDEVTEDDEDFLEDFNRLKEEFSFVTVDEVGSEEEEEEKPGTSTSRNSEGAIKTAPGEKANEKIQSSAEPDNFKIPVNPPPERRKITTFANPNVVVVDHVESKSEEPENKQRKVDSSEKSKTPSQLKEFDFLVPKAGYFCQICSCFCVDEASMKSHCQSPLHQQNMESAQEQNTAQRDLDI